MAAIFILIAQLLRLYTFVLLARILMSWIPNMDPYNPVAQFLIQVTDPVLEPARRIIPPLGMIDISPIVVFIAINILQGILMDAARGF